ncbi:MAG: putative sporulation protein YtxC [Dethiobacter sp.]|jgi:putative sporulation protein YtxC|nr:putative sporulation protein YtxC [Dethiobacter sp.]MBS3983729.1 putative sporulation protein YtxC [Dethiobacter sp.]MCL4463482.1 putative sporulation protein YtxC [Bacillota bacterium]MCL5992749.1 putative sporulation protein YtxC [Bacillota bacterium]
MSLYAIAVKHSTPDLPEKLGVGMFFFRKMGWKVSFTEKTINHWPHLFCKIESNQGAEFDQEELFGRILAENLAIFIMEQQASHYLSEIVEQSYFYFPRYERREILSLSVKHYESERSKEAGGQLLEEVRELLAVYLARRQYLNLHGFILFRLRTWLEFLRKNVDRAVDDFLWEKEYQEFIQLLKYFMTLQEPKIKLAHVILDEFGQARLLDEHYKPIEQCQEDVHWGVCDSVTDVENQLMSMLISVVPYRVVLHKQIYNFYPKTVETLKHIFESRVTFCRRCKLCLSESIYLTLKEK